MAGRSTTVFSVSLDLRLYDKLYLQARRMGMSRRQFVANAIDFYLNHREKEKHVDAWVYEPVSASLLDKLAFVRANDIKTKGELVGYLVVHKGWSHDAAAAVVNGQADVEVEGEPVT